MDNETLFPIFRKQGFFCRNNEPIVVILEINLAFLCGKNTPSD